MEELNRLSLMLKKRNDVINMMVSLLTNTYVEDLDNENILYKYRTITLVNDLDNLSDKTIELSIFVTKLIERLKQLNIRDKEINDIMSNLETLIDGLKYYINDDYLSTEYILDELSENLKMSVL